MTARKAPAAKVAKRGKTKTTEKSVVKERKPHIRTLRTPHARETFIRVLRETCNVTDAARAAGWSRRQTAYEWRDVDAEFAADWDEAEQEAADKLEREAWRRGVEGTDKPVTFQGVITATYKEYSDRMLELLLKAHRPEKFKERLAAELTGKNGGAIETRSAEMTPEQRRAEIQRLLAENPALIAHLPT